MMTSFNAPIHFLLNNEEVVAHEPPGLLVLDYLRRKRRLVGTKEGCKEGDCGACAVLVGDFQEEGQLVYQPATSCLIPLGELAGKHLVTIEGINPETGLSPLQQAIVEEGGTQCGYCTPGIVVSMTHAVISSRSHVTSDVMETALSGHLCRCTGYASLKRAGALMMKGWSEQEKAREDGNFEHQIGCLVAKGMLPAYFNTIPDRLRAA
jgi:xanthine dehydrogenase small subunit